MTQFLKLFADNQIFIVKKTWSYSKSLFLYRLVIAFFSGIMPAANAFFYYLLVDRITRGLWPEAIHVILLIVFVHLFNSILTTVIETKKIAVKGNLLNSELQVEMACKAASMDYAILFNPQMMKKREMATNLIYSDKSTNYINSTFNILSSLISIFSLGYLLTFLSGWVIVVFAVVTTARVVSVVFDKKSQYATAQDTASFNRKGSYLGTIVTDERYADECRMHSVSEWVMKKYRHLLLISHGLLVKMFTFQMKTLIFRTSVSAVESFVFYLFLASQVIFFNMTFAGFTMAFNALRSFSGSIGHITDNLISLGENAVYVRDFKDFLQTENTIDKENIGLDAISITPKEEIYALKNVSFQYPTSSGLVLSDINLSIEKNKMYVVVGENGIGKTTLVKLLCRLYDPTNGEIYFNETKTTDINCKSYRNQIGVVFQNHKYYEFTIAENVAMSEYDGTESVRHRILNALELAGLTNKVNSLPNGIDTHLGTSFEEDGILLSGGEVQKLALARVLFKDTPVVILDEPSSALDAYAEDELINTALSALKNKTVLYISHRLSVAQYAHKIIFMNNNTVEAVLPHDELLAQNTTYAEMYNMQAKRYMGGA